MKKIGLLCLALVLALGTLGIAYAAWTDTITIEGKVNTGDVDLDVVKVSSTYVSKIPDTHDMVVTRGWEPLFPPDDVIASAVAVIGPGDDEVTVTCTNLFPSVDFKVDFLFHYDGSIPARIKLPGNEGIISAIPDDPGDPGDVALAALLSAFAVPNFYGEMWKSNEAGEELVNIADLEGYQLHKCDYILLVITLHLPQDDVLMNADATVTAKIDVIQWNEYTP